MAFDALLTEVHELAGSDSLDADAKAALESATEAVLGEMLTSAGWTAGRPAQLRPQQLRLIRTMAERLQQVWELPEQQEAARVQAAQVAATRSCAYLRCANLGSGGGPAAGEGSGSSRCSACRVAW